MRLPSLPPFSWRRCAIALLAAAALLCLDIARYAVWPPVGELGTTDPDTTAFIEYRKEQWQQRGRRNTIRRIGRPLSALSPHLVKAVILAEDSTFWSHKGFDFKGIRDAMERNLERGRLTAGGSTITQQLAKNLYFSPEKSIIRKFQEALVTIRLEMLLSKQRILELYCNYVEWGDGIFGAEAAARHHFGVSASRLTPYQAACLAAMLPAPRTRTPNSPLVRKQAAIIQARMQRE